MKLTNLPPYTLGNVSLPELPDVVLTWLENGDVEIGNATDEQIDTIKRAVYTAAGAAYVPEPAFEASGGARAWFAANPATKQLFTLTIAELETEIGALVDAIVPLATQQNRTRTKKLLMALAVSVRVLVRREGL